MKLSPLSSVAAVLPAHWQQIESSIINSRNLISVVLQQVITEWGESCGSNECLVTVWKLPCLVCAFPALDHKDSGKFPVSLMHVWSPCKWWELQGRIHSTHPNFMPILGCFWKGISSIKWLLLEKTDFCDVSSAATLCSLFPHEGPCVEWLTQAFPLAVWGRYPEEVVWNHDGKRRRFCASVPMRAAQRSHHRPSKVSLVPRLCPRWLSQLWHSSTEVWLPAGHESCLTSPFLSRICWCTSSHASQYWETFQKKHLYMGLGVWRERGGRVV